MNKKNENQHYVSRVLLKRFKTPGTSLQCYQVETGEWKPRSIDKICAARGYHQLLLSGNADNTLEDAFSRVESCLPGTLNALTEAATRTSTELSTAVCENLCRYCAFLRLSSPPAKAMAIANFVFQINWELENQKYSLLRDLKIPASTLTRWTEEIRAGLKIVVDPTNALQLLYRSHFARVYWGEVGMFSTTKWTISRSPIELPLSDVGLVPLTLTELRASHYLLPIGPHLLLEGLLWHDVKKNVTRAPIKALTLTDEEAEYRFDIICSSAVKEVICSRRIDGIAESIRRAKARGITFLELRNLPDVASTGQNQACDELRFRAISSDEFTTFIHAFARPTATRL